MRDEEIQKITNEFSKKLISEDICTADGSLFVLAKYLLSKNRKWGYIYIYLLNK